ncbi:hypothetical protein M8J77_001388 [Diaphorina citri]|nr:hypothetical protein M8J77_001388 [Diaphorina citri]
MEVDVESLRDGLAPDLTVQEALDLLFAQEDPVVDTVYIAPPPAAVESDEDSCDEDTGGLADNLNHRQLQAPAEIRLPRRMESADDITIIENLHKTSSSRTWVSVNVLGVHMDTRKDTRYVPQVSIWTRAISRESHAHWKNDRSESVSFSI